MQYFACNLFYQLKNISEYILYLRHLGWSIICQIFDNIHITQSGHTGCKQRGLSRLQNIVFEVGQSGNFFGVRLFPETSASILKKK